MRLIDADALADSLRESKNKLKEILDDERCEMEYRICEGQMITFIEAILRVNETPTVDAVPVVRCKECKWAKPYDRMDGLTGYHCKQPNSTFLYGANWERHFEPVRETNDFCSYGKRRSDNE